MPAHRRPVSESRPISPREPTNSG